MTLQPVVTDSLPEGEKEVLAAILQELQGHRVSVVAGGTAVTNLNLTGAAVGDTLQSVIRIHTGVPSDVTSQASITSAGHLQLATTDTTGDVLIVSWFRKLGF